MIPGEIFTSFAEFQGIASVKWLWVSSSAPRTFVSSFPFPEKLLSCTDGLGSTDLPHRWLCRDSLSSPRTMWSAVIKSPEIFRSRHDCTSSFCTLGSQADVAISVLREVRKNCACPITLLRGSEPDSREELAGASLCSGTLSSTRLSVNSSNHSGRSRNGFPRTFSLSPFFFVLFFGFCWFMATGLHAVLLELSLLVDAWCSASCNTDVGDVGVAELEELVDKPGTTIGHVVRRVAFYPSAIFDELWYLACGPLERIFVILAEISEWENRRCIIEKLYCHE